MAHRDAAAAHVTQHSCRWLAGEKLDVVKPDPAAPVEIFDELPGERDRHGKALPDGTSGLDTRDLVHTERGVDYSIGVQCVDQSDLFGA